MLTFNTVPPDDVPLPLLLVADPSEERIRDYLPGALCLVAEEAGEVVGACVLNGLDDVTLELFNIAVDPAEQGQGIGAALLRRAVEEARVRGFKRVELGTGTFGYQLAFYQRAGFRVEAVVKDHFLTHYDEPVIESGLQHKDQLRLGLALQPEC
ncbi:MAG: GNAT family N-acetyltransferase [Alcanivorax sp.]|nr:GNAT family N-acetyltransferase [Alcanivorax sp.]UWN50790.1 putative N-acetyltransferase YvbK [Alcanivorax sp. ALC70]MAY08990.1 GNAT family N-acetyltransferase [Alcanivorax sp.]MBI52877.1 GNAT family N-acetyltransferase [Alcanivorax sp.]MBU60626.1 GNAT family N-acetyltransferase [Alcanivorax sp.]|tara:strand:- start:43334 stop:43795 length:462 start_codon:yes stop_codon:yes gene_type:complete